MLPFGYHRSRTPYPFFRLIARVQMGYNCEMYVLDIAQHIHILLPTYLKLKAASWVCLSVGACVTFFSKNFLKCSKLL